MVIRFFLLIIGLSVGGVSLGQTMVLRRCDTSAILSECQRLVMRAADRGYPFAAVSADSAVMVGRHRAHVYCNLSLSQKYNIENVYIIGGEGLAPYYVYATAGIAPGAVYNESRIRSAARRLRASGVAIVSRDAEVEFHPGGMADVYMYLDSRRANAIGAAIALCRDNMDGKYFVTGNALAELRNNFGHGERFYFAWNGYDRRSQMLDVQIRVPYVFSTPIVPDVKVNVTRADSLCLTAQIEAALGFALSPDVEIKAVADMRRMMISDKGGDAVDNNGDSRTALYGIGVDYNLWMFKNSRIKIESMATGGTRRSGGEAGSVAEISSVITGEIPLCTWMRYEGVWTGRQMYFAHLPDIHECIPIGGVGSLRGFLANELRATGLVSMSSTMRFLLSEGFSVQLFYDQAFYRCKARQTISARNTLNGIAYRDSPSGFGTGIGIRSGAASVDIGWAIGLERGKIRPMKDAKTLIIMRLDF